MRPSLPRATPTVIPTLAFLSPRRRELVLLLQQINFGRLEGLLVRGGEPVLNGPAPRVVLELKLGAENGPRPEASGGDFALRRQVVDLLGHLRRRLGDGVVGRIDVADGLPLLLEVERGPAGR